MRRGRAGWLLGALALAGCGELVPNTAPRLVSFNGVALRDLQEPGFWERPPSGVVVEPGQDFELVVEARDAQGDDIRIWLMAAPAGISLDEVTGEGVWVEPELTEIRWLEFVLEDLDAREPRWRQEDIPLFPAAQAP